MKKFIVKESLVKGSLVKGSLVKLYWILPVLLILAACGGSDPTPTPTVVAPTATPVPTATPAPTATPEPEPVAQPVSPLAMESPLAGVAPDSPLGGVAPDSPLAQPDANGFADPFAYCAAVGAVDAPDARYVGTPAPESIAVGLRAAFETPDTPLSYYQDTMVWRCMDGLVYACVIGANLPCEEQADRSTEPTEAMIAYCEEDPDSDFIPMVVTGRATVYAWSCVDGEPQAGEPFMEVDAQGFLADIWYAIEDVEGD